MHTGAGISIPVPWMGFSIPVSFGFSLMGWIFNIATGVLIAGTIFVCTQWLMAVDLAWDQERAAQFDRKVDWETARKQSVATPLLWLPLASIIFGMMVTIAMFDYSWQVYTYCAIGWWLSTPVRRYVQHAVGLRVENKLVEHKLLERVSHTESAWELTKLYYRRGWKRHTISGKEKVSRFRFVGELRFMNLIPFVISVAMRLRVYGVILLEAIIALGLPLTATFMLGHHYFSACDRITLRPWWASGPDYA